MVTPIDARNMPAVGLPDDANVTTSATVEASGKPYQSTSYVNTFCDWADREVAGIAADINAMDRDGRNSLARANSGLFGGLSAAVLSMVSGTLRAVPALLDHPVDTTKTMVKALPDAIKHMGDDIKQGASLMFKGQYAEGAFMVSKSGTDAAALLMGAEGMLKGASTVVQKGIQIGAREITAAADAVSRGMDGGAMVTAGGVYMSAEAEVAVCSAAAPMSDGGLLSGPLLMSAATLKPNEHARPGSVNVDSSLKATSKSDFMQRLKGYDEQIESLQQELATLKSQRVSWFDKNITGKTQLRIEALDKELSRLNHNKEVFIQGNQEFVEAPTWVDVPLEDAIHEEVYRALGDRTRAELSQTSIKVTTQAEFDRVLEAFDREIEYRSNPKIGPGQKHAREQMVMRLSLKKQAFIDAHPEMASARSH